MLTVTLTIRYSSIQDPPEVKGTPQDMLLRDIETALVDEDVKQLFRKLRSLIEMTISHEQSLENLRVKRRDKRDQKRN